MKPLDDELRSALRRREPPIGFTERVLARIAMAPTSQAAWRETLRNLFRMPRLRWVAGCVVVCLLAVVGVARYQREQRVRAQGKVAKEQVVQALRIASAKLNVARRKVQEIDRRTPPS